MIFYRIVNGLLWMWYVLFVLKLDVKSNYWKIYKYKFFYNIINYGRYKMCCRDGYIYKKEVFRIVLLLYNLKDCFIYLELMVRLL